MANDNFVDVAISISDRSISRENFGLPMVVAYHTVFAERVKLYADSTEAIDDGFDEESPVVAMIDAIKAQDPTVPLVAVGRRANAFSKTFTLSPVETAEAFVYSFTLRKMAGATPAISTISYTVPNGATATSIAAALATAIDAISGLTATAALGVVTVEVDVDGQIWTLQRSGKDQQEALRYEDTTADPGIAADLTAIREYYPSFYGVAIDSNSKAETVAAAAKIATFTNTVFLTESCDYSVESASGTDVLSVLRALTYANTSTPFYHRADTGAYPACRVFGIWFSKDPGSISLAHKSLAGMLPDDLSSTVIANLKALDGVCYVEKRAGLYGIHGEWAWKACSGEWLGIVRGIHWLTAEIKADQIGLIVANDKIPFTDAGIGLHSSTLQGSLLRGEVNVLTTGKTVVTTPLASSFTAAEKNARLLTGLDFSGVLQGAITATRIRGTVTH